MHSGLKTGKRRSRAKRQRVDFHQTTVYIKKKMSRGLRVTQDMSENCFLAHLTPAVLNKSLGFIEAFISAKIKLMYREIYPVT